MTGSKGDGIRLYYSPNGNNVSENNVVNNVVGIHISLSSDNNTISQNNVTGNSRGVEFWDSSDNTVSENVISNNGVGAYISEASSNKFYHNNFMGNIPQVYFSTSGFGNIWDDGYPSGGNYWSDYNGTDANHDGIGDTSYTIDGNNTDHYPLMVPYVIPEFPSFVFLPLFFIATLLAVIAHRKRGTKNRKTSSD